MDVKNLFYPLGECAVVVKLGDEIDMKTHQKVVQLSRNLEKNQFVGMVESVSAYTTVTIYYDPYIVITNYKNPGNKLDKEISAYQVVCETLKPLLTLDQETDTENTVVHIPVYYGDEFGPDLEFVANCNGLTTEEVIRIHTNGTYPVYMIGFTPGFPYLGGMSERIAAPRKSSPRKSIPAGSVGIAGKQTGIYSIDCPGGWQLIGRTPIHLFQPQSNPPSLLQAGDTVRFTRISREAFDAWEVEIS